MENNLYELAEQLMKELPYIKKEGKDLLKEVNQKFRRLSPTEIGEKTLWFCEQNYNYKTYIAYVLAKLYEDSGSDEVFFLLVQAKEDLETFEYSISVLKSSFKTIAKEEWLKMLQNQVHQTPILIERFASLVKIMLDFENAEE